MWLAILLGALGGVANSLLLEDGFVMPHRDKKENAIVLRLGFIGNIILGGIAGLAVYFLAGKDLDPYRQSGLALIGGVGGGNVLTSFLQKQDLTVLKSRYGALETTIEKLSGLSEKD